MLNWKNVFKSWYGVPVLILAVLAVLWFLPTFKEWRIQRAYDKVEEPYYTDTYGGSTPEETYDLFIEALKAGDVELASRYFVLEKQEDWLRTFSELKNSGTLVAYSKEVGDYRTSLVLKNKDEKEAIFSYQYSREEPEVVELPVSDDQTQKVTLPVGKFEGQVTFVKYPNVWKVEEI